jgi:hypothetical protein
MFQEMRLAALLQKPGQMFAVIHHRSTEIPVHEALQSFRNNQMARNRESSLQTRVKRQRLTKRTL